MLFCAQVGVRVSPSMETLLTCCDDYNHQNWNFRMHKVAVSTLRGKFFEGKTFTIWTKHTVHWKTFAVHQAKAIMYCTQQMILGENFHNSMKNTAKVSPQNICQVQYNLCFFNKGSLFKGKHFHKCYSSFFGLKVKQLILSDYTCWSLCNKVTCLNQLT